MISPRCRHSSSNCVRLHSVLSAISLLVMIGSVLRVSATIANRVTRYRCWYLPRNNRHTLAFLSNTSRQRECIPKNGISTRLFSAENNEATTNLTLEIPTAEDTEEVGALLSAIVLQNQEQAKGSTIFLDGDLGAGKTAFARGFLRAATGDDDLLVTSPTYLLVNVYPILNNALEIHHMDLYRLEGNPDDFLPLNLPHVFDQCVSLIEWPQRLARVPLPENRLDINIRIQSDIDSISSRDDEDEDDDKARIMTLRPMGSVWEARIESIRSEGYLDDLIL